MQKILKKFLEYNKVLFSNEKYCLVSMVKYGINIRNQMKYLNM